MTTEMLSDNAIKIVMPQKLSAADVATVAAALDGAITQHGRIRLLADMRNFGGWENMEALGAHLDQLRFIAERAKHIDRIAVIVGYPWQQQVIAFLRNVLPTQVQPFESSEETAAKDWLLQGAA
jgi:hypothetical protein